MARRDQPGAEQWVPEGEVDLGDLRAGVQQCRGCELFERSGVVPTTHPSAVLRTDDHKAAYDALVADLLVVAGLL